MAHGTFRNQELNMAKETKKETGKEPVAEKIEVVNPFDPYKIIKAPLSTEKAIKSVEFDNKLTFIVNPRATKSEVKRAVEELFKVTVTKVNIQNSFRGQKLAYVRLGANSSASDVSADLGMI